MQTHSSSIVAIKAAQALEELLNREFNTVEEFRRALERNSSALRGASPSHASLWTTQREILERVEAEAPSSVEAGKATVGEAIEQVVERVEAAKTAAAANAADVLTDGATILTHDYSSTMLEAITQATDAGKSFDVYVTEARPRFLGRKSARQLGAMAGATARLIVDSAMGYYLEECDRVMVGMDCIVDDLLYNRVGTYPLAATANDQGIPVSVVGSSAKLVDGGFRFENEFRSTAEVMREPAEDFAVLNPAYDATPVRLLESVITDEGVHQP